MADNTYTLISEHHRQIGSIADTLGIPCTTDSPTKTVSQIIEAIVSLKNQFTAGTTMGPGTENVCGLYICRNCGTEDAHSWEQCATELRLSRDRNDGAVEEEREACAKVALDILVGNTEITTKDANESRTWKECAEFVCDMIRSRE